MANLECVGYRTVRTERLFLSRRQMITQLQLVAPQLASSIEFLSSEDIATGNLILELRGWILAGSHGRETRGEKIEWKVPDGWFQTLKHEHFPRWLIRHLPVRWRRFTRTVEWQEGPWYVCPHSNIAWPHSKHLEFLLAGPKEPREES